MRVVVVACVLLFLGCGDAAPAGDDTSCTGCTQDGTCLAGTGDTTCGRGGATCAPCTGADTCQDGECLAPRSCTALTCPDGCCDDDDTCQPGATRDACGDGGGRCATCASGSCIAGSCVLRCDPQTCAGCCDAAGQCITATTPGACGKNGAACEACDSGQRCVAGTCSDSSCLTTCLGCCTGTVCTAGSQSDSAHCGTTGEVCATCGPGAICTNGDCVPDEETRWDLVLLSGEVAETEPGGTAWDAFGGLPDPSLCARSASTESCSPYAENTTLPVWTAPMIENATPAAILAMNVWSMYDDDTSSFDDPMGSCVNAQSDYAMFDGNVHVFACTAANASPAGYVANWTVRYKLVQR